MSSYPRRIRKHRFMTIQVLFSNKDVNLNIILLHVKTIVQYSEMFFIFFLSSTNGERYLKVNNYLFDYINEIFLNDNGKICYQQKRPLIYT